MAAKNGASDAHRSRDRLGDIIFGTETPAGKTFDLILIIAILVSVAVVMLESTEYFRTNYGPLLTGLEWGFTILFTVEYLMRLYTAARPWRYARSFFGIVDLLSIIPTYISYFFPGTQVLVAIRTLRILRVFRVLKLVKFVREAGVLGRAIVASRHKIIVFLYTVLVLAVIVGSLMYLIEGEEHGFTSIPRSIYWAIVTVTTVGYGDITPQTVAGQTLSAFLMIMGYAIIAVPTGIVTTELAREEMRSTARLMCRSCNTEGHDPDAAYCKFCGEALINHLNAQRE